MNSRRLFLALGAAVLFAPVSQCAAQAGKAADDRADQERYEAEGNAQNFAGWKGILFHCAKLPPSSRLAAQVCDRTTTNAEFLAAAAKVELTKVTDGSALRARALKGDFLVLEVSVYATQPGSLAGISASIRAYNPYLHAIEDPRFPIEKQDPIRAKPRSGDLVAWERTILGAATREDYDKFVPAMAENIRLTLTQFFTEYLKARK